MSARPRPKPRVPLPWLAAAAVICVGSVLAVEAVTQAPTHPRYAEMLVAARTMQSASAVLAEEKQKRGLMQPDDIDPNRTGMIGPEYTSLTTTLGDVASKRTTTNPDFAAALVGQLSTLDLPRGAAAVIILSGSFVGGDIAAVAAVEALGLKPIILASLGSSMWGATDPAFNLLDILAVLRTRGVIGARTMAATLGGESGIGRDMEPSGIVALHASAARDGVPMVEARPLGALINALLEHIYTAAAGERLGVVINVGGALVGTGSCAESYEFPPGLTKQPRSCTGGTPGVAMRLANQGLPVLHLLNMRRLAVEFGLPFDPEPLPTPGDNAAIYGRVLRNAN
jgi:poly-gamma-glutamate system protein